MQKTMNELHKESQSAIVIQSLIVLLGGVVIGMLLRSFVISRLGKQRLQVFNAFKSLSKSSISLVVQKLNAQSGKSVDESTRVPLNPQERSAIRKLWTPIEEEQSFFHPSEGLLFQIASLLWVLSVISVIVVFQVTPRALFTTMQAVSSFYSQYIEIHMQFTQISLLEHRAMLQASPFLTPADNLSEVLETARTMINTTRYSISVNRFGDWRANAGYLTAMRAELAERVTRSSINIEFLWQHPDDFSLLAEMSFENSITFMIQTLYDIAETLSVNSTAVTIRDTVISLITCYLLDVSFTQFLTPMLARTTTSLSDAVQILRGTMLIIPISLLIVLMVASGFLLLPGLLTSADVVHWFLRLLLLCEPRVVTDSKALFKILSNDFSASVDDADDSAGFYDRIIGASSDPTFFIDNTFRIRSVNRRACALLGLTEDCLNHQMLFDVLQPGTEECEGVASLRSFRAAVDSALLGLRSPCIESDIEIACAGESAPVHANLIAISPRGKVQHDVTLADGIALFTLTLGDLRAGILAREALKRERARLDELLSTMLPARVLGRWENDKEVAYYVPSASFLVVMIDDFAQWCAVQQDPLTRLQSLFDSFDAVVRGHNDMTVLRPMNAFFLAVGGIFSEGTPPQVHTKQAVSTGLDIIQAIEEFNRNTQLHVRARLSVVNGERMIAGVLQLEMPTFEILGAPWSKGISLAENARPMTVAITQKEFELVYFGHFVIQEGVQLAIGDTRIPSFVVTAYDK
jgi:PAS domain-containing protein